MRFNILLATCLSFPAFAQDPLLLTGSYDSPRGTGIHVYRFSKGETTLLFQQPSSQASYLTLSPVGNRVYAVNERGDSTGKAGTISTYSLDARSGTLQFLSQVSAEGNYPCHITTDRTGKWLVVSNYGTGNWSVYGLDAQGIPGPARQVIQHTGRGPDSVRQRSPHVHGAFFSPDNQYIWITDLGTDQVYRYRFDAASGQVTGKPEQVIPCRGGGPRHLEQSADGRFLYVLMEITGEVMVLEKKQGGMWETVQNLSTLSETGSGAAGSAAIHRSPDGRHLYVTNRGNYNDLVHFRVHPRTGRLKRQAHYPANGKHPRDFSLAPGGRYLLAANRDNDEIVVFRRHPRSGKLQDSGKRIVLGKPVCLIWQ